MNTTTEARLKEHRDTNQQNVSKQQSLEGQFIEDPTQILEIYLVVNGALNMSAGKIASQSFQAAQRLIDAANDPSCDPAHRQRIEQWKQQGTRTICRLAQTQHIFDRLRQEVPGATMVDEGLTEVQPGSATVHATWPIWRNQAPRMIKHKRCVVYGGAPR